MSKKASAKSRFYATLVYPENCSCDWSKAEKFAVPFCVSPLHAPESSGDEKQFKPHYHIMLDYRRYVGSSMAQKWSDQFSGVNVFTVDVPTSYYDYLTHRNNPEKQQFAESCEPLLFCGFEPPRQADDVLIDSMAFVYGEILNSLSVWCYQDAINWCLANDVRYLPTITRNAFAIKQFLLDKERMKKNDL